MDDTDLEFRFRRVRLLALDLDGVLTDGGLYYGNYGDELKRFHIHDGYGIVMLRRAGIPTVVISGKKSAINRRRAKELKIWRLFENANRKEEILDKVLKKLKLRHEEVCFVGDDLIDLPVLTRVGLAVAVHNAVDEVKAASHWVTHRRGGDGAVREVIDRILRSRQPFSAGPVSLEPR